MLRRTLIRHALTSEEPRDQIRVMGWVRTRRDAKGFSFLQLNDGSCLASLQVLVEESVADKMTLTRCTTGASAAATCSVSIGATADQLATGTTGNIHSGGVTSLASTTSHRRWANRGRAPLA